MSIIIYLKPSTDSFQNVCKLMKAILCIPHSNASSERTFSMVRKIVTENMTDIGNDTVCALLRCKLNCDKRACEYKLIKDELKAAKSATYLYNQVHSKKLKASHDAGSLFRKNLPLWGFQKLTGMTLASIIIN